MPAACDIFRQTEWQPDKGAIGVLHTPCKVQTKLAAHRINRTELWSALTLRDSVRRCDWPRRDFAEQDSQSGNHRAGFHNDMKHCFAFAACIVSTFTACLQGRSAGGLLHFVGYFDCYIFPGACLNR